MGLYPVLLLGLNAMKIGYHITAAHNRITGKMHTQSSRQWSSVSHSLTPFSPPEFPTGVRQYADAGAGGRHVAGPAGRQAFHTLNLLRALPTMKKTLLLALALVGCFVFGSSSALAAHLVINNPSAFSAADRTGDVGAEFSFQFSSPTLSRSYGIDSMLGTV